MSLFLKIFLTVGTFFGMEWVAWATHKYIMHGFMWRWHEDHHHPHKGFFEKNDYFAVVFAGVSITLFALGTFVPALGFLFWIALGITGYGIFYFIFHDVIVHRRLPIRFVARSAYMKRIMRAHYIHHKVHSREGGQAFGFLWAPKKFEKMKV